MDFSNFWTKKKPVVTVKIKTRRPMRLPVDGETQHVDAGVELDLPLDVVRGLDRADFVQLSKLPAMEIPDPSPDRDDPAPPPARWSQELPECFAAYWKIREEFRVAQKHIRDIIKVRVQIFGSNLRIGKAHGTALVGSFHFSDDPRNKNVLSTLKPFDLDDPEIRAQDKFLAAAEDRAEDHLRRLRETKFRPMQEAYLACGGHLIRQTEKLAGIVEELAEIGLSIFATRVQALGLGENAVRKLYCGSADCLKYCHPTPSLSRLTSGGFDEEGTQRVYIDGSVEQTAGQSLATAARIDELSPLLTEGRAELKRTKKAAA